MQRLKLLLGNRLDPAYPIDGVTHVAGADGIKNKVDGADGGNPQIGVPCRGWRRPAGDLV